MLKVGRSLYTHSGEKGEFAPKYRKNRPIRQLCPFGGKVRPSLVKISTKSAIQAVGLFAL